MQTESLATDDEQARSAMRTNCSTESPAATLCSRYTERDGAKVLSSGGGAPRELRNADRIPRNRRRASAKRDADQLLDRVPRCDALFQIHRARRREGVIERGWGPARIKKCRPNPSQPTTSKREARCGPIARPSPPLRRSVPDTPSATARRCYRAGVGPREN